jgi:hypothetical protein
MKGQTQAVTVVLITGVIVGAVSSAYIWGTPLLEKRSQQSDISPLESDIVDVSEKIVSVARSGNGATGEISLDMENSRIKVNESADLIRIRTPLKGTGYPLGSWRLLKGSNRRGTSIGSGAYGVEGDNSPVIVAAKKTGSSGSLVTYLIDFRNMRTETPSGSRLKRIDLQSSGVSEARGSTSFFFSNEGESFDSGSNSVQISNGDDFNRARTVISVDLR